LAAALTIGWLVGSLPSRAVAAADAPVAARPPVPDLPLRAADGEAVKLADLKGQVVLLDFWATWCTGCKVEIPWFMDFQRKYGGQGLVSIGVAMDDEGWPIVAPYVAQHPFNYRIVVGGADLLAMYPISNMPVTLLIDRRGRIAESHVGVVDRKGWERRIRTLLREKAS
jgi:cytochrome c biogenesis protein CcmG/thiol:disulfide interchange protein DsbE